MEFKELIAKRRSVRKFTDREVPRSTVDRILHEALSAPSAPQYAHDAFSGGRRSRAGGPHGRNARLRVGVSEGARRWRSWCWATPRRATCGVRTPQFRPRCSSWPASTKGWLRAGCTSTGGPAARTFPTVRRRPSTSGLSCPSLPAANPSAPLPWAIPTSPPPRCRRPTTRRGFFRLE